MILDRLYRRFSPAAQHSFVLMYHRIAEERIDPWNNCVSPAHFNAQLRWLSQHYRIISADQFLHEWKSRKLQERSVVLTFDDGYADNAAIAVPALKDLGLPATFFLTNERRWYWWDELEARILRTDLTRSSFEWREEGSTHRFDLSGEEVLHPEVLGKLERWKGPEAPDSKRAALYLSLVEMIRRSGIPARERVMDQVRSWSGVEAKTPAIMSEASIRATARDPLFTIGAHTVHHPVLSALPAQEQEKEIEGNLWFLEVLTGQRPGLLAYPHGAYNAATLPLLTKHGIKAAFTTRHHSLRYAPSRLEIGRYQMPDSAWIPFLSAAGRQRIHP